MARKITGESETAKDKILRNLDEGKTDKQKSEYLIDTVNDDYGKVLKTLVCMFV